MRVKLPDGFTVTFNFKTVPQKHGNHTTVCIATLDDGKTLTRHVTATARCHRRDFYNRATGKAKALAKALDRFWPRPMERDLRVCSGSEMAAIRRRRAFRLLVWGRFYRTLITPDMVFLSGYMRG